MHEKKKSSTGHAVLIINTSDTEMFQTSISKRLQHSRLFDRYVALILVDIDRRIGCMSF